MAPLDVAPSIGATCDFLAAEEPINPNASRSNFERCVRWIKSQLENVGFRANAKARIPVVCNPPTDK